MQSTHQNTHTHTHLCRHSYPLKSSLSMKMEHVQSRWSHIKYFMVEKYRSH